MPKIALVTCAALPELDADERLLLDALVALGADVDAAVWDDPGVIWRGFDAAVIRSTWDYTEDVFAFREWAARAGLATRLLNSADVIAWNTDKRYLLDLADAGLAVVPTTFIAPEDRAHTAVIPSEQHAEFVVKPAVSAGSRDTARYSVTADLEAAGAHVDRLLADGRVVMIQPYFESVDTIGETGMIFIDGEFSHAIRKGQMLHAGREGDTVEGLYVREQIDPMDVTDAQLRLAREVLAAIPVLDEAPLYARVDLIPDASGQPLLLELELTEPSLFFAHEPQAAERMARAILARV